MKPNYLFAYITYLHIYYIIIHSRSLLNSAQCKLNLTIINAQIHTRIGTYEFGSVQYSGANAKLLCEYVKAHCTFNIL